MFSLTTRSLYGLTAVFELARNYQKGRLQARDIAEKHKIPQHYLEQLLVALKKTGTVKSFRGTQGGYALTCPPAQLKVIDVLKALEGNLSVIPAGSQAEELDFFWKSIEESIGKVLDMNLDQLILEKNRLEQNITYSI